MNKRLKEMLRNGLGVEEDITGEPTTKENVKCKLIRTIVSFIVVLPLGIATLIYGISSKWGNVSALGIFLLFGAIIELVMIIRGAIVLKHYNEIMDKTDKRG
ncbi:MAG: hypothetical protein HFJ81_06745 [Clostridia bacterium]|nr:hypothetical protein [Clostridia bacterium]